MSLQKHMNAVRFFAMAMQWVSWLQATAHKLTPPPFRLIQIGSAFWQSRALYVAAKLDIATILGDGMFDSQTLGERAASPADAIGRLLRLLAAIGVFEEVAPLVFRNNPLSACLRTDNPKNVRAMVLLHNADEMARPWFEQLEKGVRTGTPPFELSHNEALFDYLDRHPEFDGLFSEAMDSVEALAGDSFATDFAWGRFGRVIDVGGSRGSKSLAILKRHRNMTALVVDRPQVVAEAEQYWAANPAGGSGRLRFQAGDFLLSIPPARDSRDIIFLSAILHGFDDDTCTDILRNAAQACAGTGARIALLEMVLPETGAGIAEASCDLQMLMASKGRERTLPQWVGLFKRSGVTLEEHVRLRSLGSILVLRADMQP